MSDAVADLQDKIARLEMRIQDLEDHLFPWTKEARGRFLSNELCQRHGCNESREAVPKTESGAPCLWVDQDRDEGVHRMCPDHAVDWVETETGVVPLCEVHAWIAKEEGIAKP